MVNNNEPEYFLLGPNEDSDRRARAEITKQIKIDSKDVFSGM